MFGYFVFTAFIKDDKSYIELFDILSDCKELIQGKLLIELIMLLSKTRYFRFGKESATLKSLL
jgi:hypothetical protein